VAIVAGQTSFSAKIAGSCVPSFRQLATAWLAVSLTGRNGSLKVGKARKALRRIRKYPDNHDQGDWNGGGDLETFACASDNGEHPPCGTTMCMAGWVSFLEAPSGSVFTRDASWFTMPDGTTRGMPDFAADSLALTDTQQAVMFYAAKDANDLEKVINCIADNPKAESYELYAALGIDPDE
jgi:hypothetical protein